MMSCMPVRASGGALALILFLLAHTGTGGATPSDPTGRRQTLLGRSVDGRPIVAIETGDFDAHQRVLVVGCIHGNEPAGVAIASRLAHITPPREAEPRVVPDL